MVLATPAVCDPGAIKFFFVTVLTKEGFGGILAKEVLVVVLTSKVLGPVPRPTWSMAMKMKIMITISLSMVLKATVTCFDGQSLQRSAW